MSPVSPCRPARLRSVSAALLGSFLLLGVVVATPVPAEACHNYESPRTGDVGCGARKADQRYEKKNSGRSGGSSRNSSSSNNDNVCRTSS